MVRQARDVLRIRDGQSKAILGFTLALGLIAPATPPPLSDALPHSSAEPLLDHFIETSILSWEG